jgi:ABC-type transport system involved in multi-copper enzyme maturation permease subunit
MIAELKAEVRKLFTIRSTYVIIGIALALEFFLAFFISGWRADAPTLHNPGTFTAAIQGAIRLLSIFSALIALLLMTHEFRYNTVAYSLTLSNNRSKLLAAKIIVLSIFALIFTAITATLSPLLTSWGMHAHNLHLVAQTITYSSIVWRGLLYGWGYTMVGLVLAVIIRNQIGTIVTLFIVPGTVEAILMLWLKQHVVYLPFTALSSILGGNDQGTYQNSISHFHAALVFGAYLLVSWIVAWVLFIRNDVI